MATTAKPSLESLAIGVDIGGTGTKFGIVDRVGNVLFSGEISTKKHKQVDTFIDDLHNNLVPIIERAGGVGRIKGMGVGAPNGNVYTGTIEYAPNLPWKGIVPLAKLIQDKFQLPVVLTNDANAAAIGEMTYGAAQGMKDFIMTNWYAVFAPAKTGAALADAIRTDLRRVYDDPATKSRYVSAGVDAIWMDDKELARTIERDLAKWTQVVRETNIKTD